MVAKSRDPNSATVHDIARHELLTIGLDQDVEGWTTVETREIIEKSDYEGGVP